jgi:hypothetical protein
VREGLLLRLLALAKRCGDAASSSSGDYVIAVAVAVAAVLTAAAVTAAAATAAAVVVAATAVACRSAVDRECVIQYWRELMLSCDRTTSGTSANITSSTEQWHTQQQYSIHHNSRARTLCYT